MLDDSLFDCPEDPSIMAPTDTPMPPFVPVPSVTVRATSNCTNCAASPEAIKIPCLIASSASVLRYGFILAPCSFVFDCAFLTPDAICDSVSSTKVFRFIFSPNDRHNQTPSGGLC